MEVRKMFEEQLQLLSERSKMEDAELLPALIDAMLKITTYLECGSQPADAGLALPVAVLSEKDLEDLKAVRTERARRVEECLRKRGVEFA